MMTLGVTAKVSRTAFVLLALGCGGRAETQTSAGGGGANSQTSAGGGAGSTTRGGQTSAGAYSGVINGIPPQESSGGSDEAPEEDSGGAPGGCDGACFVRDSHCTETGAHDGKAQTFSCCPGPQSGTLEWTAIDDCQYGAR